MYGVVLWSDRAVRKAVFWCEDQGDLAFYHDASTKSDSYGFLDAGDMVQFEVKLDHKLRKAHNARIVLEKACAELPEHLLSTASMSSETIRKTAQVIDFEPPRSKSQTHSLLRKA